MSEQWLSIVEFARMHGLSDMTVRRRIKAGKLDAVLKDQKYYIRIRVPSAEVQQPMAPQPAPRRPMTHEVMKSHPQAQRTYQGAAFGEPSARGAMPYTQAMQQHLPPPPQMIAVPEPVEEDDEPSMIPSTLKRPLSGYEQSLVDTRALLAFCEATLRKMQDVERRQVEKFKAKLEAVEATLAARDQENKGLKQKLEDLELLVRIMERKR